jgi:phosphoglycerol transferase
MVTALAGAATALRLWRANLHVPFSVSGDANLYMMLVQDLLHSSWYLESNLLGAPQGRELYDYAAFSGDVASMLIVKGLGVVVDDVALATNAYYLLTFPLIAAVAHLVLRRLGASPPASAACAVLYALAPYHFLRGEGHLFIAGYFAVPVAAYLVLAVLLGHRLLRGREWRPALAVVAACVLVAWGSVYYAVFTLVLLALACLIAAVRRELPNVRQGMALIGVLAAALVVTLSPHIVHRIRHGPNPVVSVRQPFESEQFALTPAQLLMPIPGHRLKPLAHLADRYMATTKTPGERSAQLGIVAALALVAAFAIVLASALAPDRLARIGPLPRAASIAAVLSLLLGTTGGVSSVIAYLLSPQIRGWARLSIFIAFFVLVLLAVGFDALRRRWGTAPWLAALAAVVVVGFLDGTSAAGPDYDGPARVWASDGRFVHAIEGRLGAGAMVFQLPYMGYPEVPAIGGMLDYDPAKGFLHSTKLHWSYGGMRGRASEWADDASALPIRGLLPSVAAAGFSGIWVDRAAYADRAAGLERELTRRIGAGPMASENGRLAFYDLRGYAERLRRRYGAGRVRALRDATLHPLPTWKASFYAAPTDGVSAYRWMGPRGTLELRNRSAAAHDVLVQARLASPAPAHVEARLPDGRVEHLESAPSPKPLRLRVRVPPGLSRIKLATDAPRAPAVSGDPRDLRLRLDEPLVIDAQARPVLAGP